MHRVRYSVVVSYQPMGLAELARFIAGEPDFDTRWRLVVEFLKEYHREPAGARQRLSVMHRGNQCGFPPSGHLASFPTA